MIAAQLVRHQTPWFGPLTFERLTKEPLSGPSVAAFLNEHIDDISVLVNRAPELVPLIIDDNE